jgi:hypothetical protein
MSPEEVYGGPGVFNTPLSTYEFVNSTPFSLEDELEIELESRRSKTINLYKIASRYQHTVDNLLLLEKILEHSQGTVNVEVVGASIYVTGPEGYLNQFCDGDDGVLIIPE